MPKTPQLSVAPSSTATSTTGSAKRRSTRIPARSEEGVASLDIPNDMRDRDSAKNVDDANSLGSSSPAPREGWKHPAELQYIRRADWSQDLMITYLCQKAFTVPPRQTNTTLSYTEITRSFSGEKIQVPRGYRIPLMFVAKFQWESLRLVLNSASEWEEYKFDIIHLSRLCTHFFKQAKSAVSENKLTKAWRSPMFDRALIRFYRKWMVSREWSVKKFWEEFDEEEYKLDVLRFDWSRWVLKGHKGFVLTKEEVQNGVTADQYKHGLKRKPDGTWAWDDSGVKDTTSLDVLNSLASQDAVEAITNATPSHDSIEVKQELLEINHDDVVLNQNGKRPRKVSTRLFKRHKKTSPKKKNTISLVRDVSHSSGDERPETLKGSQYQEETGGTDKDSVPQSFSLTHTLKIIPLSHGNKRDTVKPSSSATITMSPTPIDIPSNLDLSLIPASTSGPVSAQTPESPSVNALFPTQLSIPSPAENGGDQEISHMPPLSVPSDAQILNSTLKTIPNPWPTKPSESTQLDACSSFDVMQTDTIDPEVMPNAEISDASNDLIFDVPPLPPLPSPPDPSSPTLPLSPTLPEINLPIPPISMSTINPNPSLPTALSLSSPLTPAIPEGAHISVLPPTLPYSNTDSNGSVDFDSGDQNSDSAFLPEFKVKIIQSILDTVQKMAAAPLVKEQQTTIISEAEEKKNMEDSIVIPLSPALSQSEQLIQPASLISSSAGEVEVETSVVEGVHAEESGEVTNSEDSIMIVPVDSGPETVKGEVKTDEKDMVGEPEVVDIMDDTDVRVENCSVEAQPQQEMSSVDDMDEADAVREEDAVETRPVHTPMDNTGGMGIALEVGVVEGQSFDSQSFAGTLPTEDDSKAAYDSTIESAPAEGGEVEIMDAGDSEDKMNVDEETIQPTPSLLTDGSSSTSVSRTKSLYSIQLLQSLIRFLQIPARPLGGLSRLDDGLTNLKNQGTCPAIEQAHDALLLRPHLLTEEVIGIDQRADILAHVSATLAKHLYPYKGTELEAKIDLLDKSLRQQFETIQKLDGRSYQEIDEPFKDLGVYAEFDRIIASISTQKVSQGVQTSLDRQFENLQVQTEVENQVTAPPQSLGVDATMVDLTIPTPPPLQEPPSTPPDNNRSVAKTVMSMMRNMADLLECTTQGSSQGSVRSLKGKEKEVIDVDTMRDYLDSPALATILEEFKSIKEEMRRSQHRSQSEVESLRLSHFMQVEALKDEIRNIEGRGKQELEDVTRRYNQQIGELKATLRLTEERGRLRESESEKVPSLELLEIRRRVASLEARSRSDSLSGDTLRSNSRSSMTNGHYFTEPVMTRHSNFNLPDFEDQQPYTTTTTTATTFKTPRQFIREGSMSKPGTPTPTDSRQHHHHHPFSNRHSEVIMDLDESMPLPAKSQRKMHIMNFPRPPMG